MENPIEMKIDSYGDITITTNNEYDLDFINYNS